MRDKKKLPAFLLPFLCALLLSGAGTYAIPYDYSATTECLKDSPKPQYNGGIITNPDFNDGLRGWSQLGDSKIETKESGGNNFVVAKERNQPYDSVSQKLYLKRGIFYTLSAWLQLSEGEATVVATFKTRNGYEHAGAVVAKSNCWSMLKGGITVNESGPGELYFESENTTVEIWVDSISLQPFTQDEWNFHQAESIRKTRKGTVKIKAVDRYGNSVPNATVTIEQKKLGFPFGCEITSDILGSIPYQNWLAQRFTVTTFANEMKWYSNENTRGREDYSKADAMLRLCKEHGIGVRGHNVLWDDPQYQLSWLKWLPEDQLYDAVKERVSSVMSRYRGQLIAWDVINENLHFNFFESKMGPNASGLIFNLAHVADPQTMLFMNDYNTIEEPSDKASAPARYIEKLKEIQSFPGNEQIKFGIGLESHFRVPNIPYMRSTIDMLSATGAPVWLTEIDVQNTPDLQPKYLEQILREGHSHPKVQGMVLWAGYDPKGCYHMCLTDGNFKNLPTGDVVDKLIREWGGLNGRNAGVTDPNGVFEASLFHGDYEVNIDHPERLNSTKIHSFRLDQAEEDGGNDYIMEIHV